MLTARRGIADVVFDHTCGLMMLQACPDCSGCEFVGAKVFRASKHALQLSRKLLSLSVSAILDVDTPYMKAVIKSVFVRQR